MKCRLLRGAVLLDAVIRAFCCFHLQSSWRLLQSLSLSDMPVSRCRGPNLDDMTRLSPETPLADQQTEPSPVVCGVA